MEIQQCDSICRSAGLIAAGDIELCAAAAVAAEGVKLKPLAAADE